MKQFRKHIWADDRAKKGKLRGMWKYFLHSFFLPAFYNRGETDTRALEVWRICDLHKLDIWHRLVQAGMVFCVASQEAAYAGPEFLDVQKKGVNKGLGMKKLLEALHLEKVLENVPEKNLEKY